MLLHPNVLFELVSIDTWTDIKLIHRFGELWKDPFVTIHGQAAGSAAPRHLIQ